MCHFYWLGIADIFQTFEGLDSINDKQADIQVICQVFDKNSAIQDNEKGNR
jgi:hypothetical protein